MSTIFGGLFFVILLLMGFNLMVWNFAQYDAYNQVISKMSQRDQQAMSENVVVSQPGAVDFNVPGNTFNITVTNLGGISVSIARIYINNISPTGSTQCSTSSPINPCIIDPTPSTSSCPGGNCYFTNGNIQVGELNHKVTVNGLLVNDGSGYRIILSTTRGRLFSFGLGR
jgi:hypothetical protein